MSKHANPARHFPWCDRDRCEPLGTGETRHVSIRTVYETKEQVFTVELVRYTPDGEPTIQLGAVNTAVQVPDELWFLEAQEAKALAEKLLIAYLATGVPTQLRHAS